MTIPPGDEPHKPKLLTEVRRAMRLRHEEDLANGFGTGHLPHALERKYPHAHRQCLRGVLDRDGVSEHHHHPLPTFALDNAPP